MSIQLGLATYGGLPVAAWKGPFNDSAIHFAQYNTTGAGQWEYAGTIPGAETAIGPILTNVSNGSLFAGWSGGPQNTNMSLFAIATPLTENIPIQSVSWTPVGIAVARSVFGPGLAILSENGVHVLAAIWAGSSLAGEQEPIGASKVWCSVAPVDQTGSIPPGAWIADNQIPEAEAYAVSVASDGEQKLYVAWTMTDGSNRCQYVTGYFAGASASSPGVVGFTGAQFLPSVTSANTPTMAVAEQTVVVLWRDPESRLYCNSLTEIMAGAAPSPILYNGQPATSTDNPAAYEALGGLFVIWKGAGNDGTIYSALYDVNTKSWNSFGTLPGYTSQNSPEPIHPEPIRLRKEL